MAAAGAVTQALAEPGPGGERPGRPVTLPIPLPAAQPGPDTFLFHPNSGTTAISHFDPSEDVIRFQGTSLADFAAVLDHTADNGHGNAVITYDAHSAITLEGVTRDMLHASNFQLV